MNKSAKNSVALFLAAALLTGVFSVSSPSIIDTEATEEKKYGYDDDKKYVEDKRYGDEKKYAEDKSYGDEKKYSDEEKYGDEKKYAEDKSYGDEKKYSDDKSYGDEEKYSDEKKYGYGDEKKYGYGDDKKYGYGDDKKYGDEKKYGYEQYTEYDDKKSFKHAVCSNININGKSFQMNHGDGPRGYDGYDGMMRGGGDGHGKMNSYVNDHGKFPGIIKETDKDLTVICINEVKSGNQTHGNQTKDPRTAEGCFKKYLNSTAFTAFETFLAIAPIDVTFDQYIQMFEKDSFFEIAVALDKDLKMIGITLSLEDLRGLTACILKILDDKDRPHFPPRGY